jgi:hypothetical protein
VKTYRVTVHSKATGSVYSDYLYITAQSKQSAIREAHQEADRREWFDRWAIYPHDLVRVDPTTKEEVDL